MNELLKRLGIGALIGLIAGFVINYGTNFEGFFLTDLLDGYEYQSYDAVCDLELQVQKRHPLIL